MNNRFKTIAICFILIAIVDNTVSIFFETELKDSFEILFIAFITAWCTEESK